MEGKAMLMQYLHEKLKDGKIQLDSKVFEELMKKLENPDDLVFIVC
jgi:hypothetical protein